jgi:hypothetical protein
VFNPAITKPLARFWSRNNLSKHLPVNISTIVSNVAGPNVPLYCAGARLVDCYGLGVLTPGIGVFHLVLSYSGRITLSVLADRDILLDPEFYRGCLVASYEELNAAIQAQQKPAMRTKRKTVHRIKAKVSPEAKTTKLRVVRAVPN